MSSYLLLVQVAHLNTLHHAGISWGIVMRPFRRVMRLNPGLLDEYKSILTTTGVRLRVPGAHCTVLLESL